MVPLESKAKVLVQKAVTLIASMALVRWKEALAPTKAARRPLQRIPVLAQQEQTRKKLLRRMPAFCRQLGGRFWQRLVPGGLKKMRSGECTTHNRGAWPRD
jgi:hypothetical protein